MHYSNDILRAYNSWKFAAHGTKRKNHYFHLFACACEGEHKNVIEVVKRIY